MSTTITLRKLSWQPDSTVEVTLTPAAHGDAWDVTYKGQGIGCVGRYTGSISSKVKGTRFRRTGKPRTLWSSTSPATEANPHPRPLNGELNRADAIRTLIERAEFGR